MPQPLTLMTRRDADVLSPADPAASVATPPVYPSHLTGESLRLAAIDVGSNSIHMVVAQIDPDGGVTTLWRMKEHTALGRLTFPKRHINKQAIDRGLAVLARFKHAAQAKQAEKFVAVATSAVREASNGGEFIERAWREHRIRIRVVDAREEARLIYLGARHGGGFGDAPDEPGLLLDVGGGSAEVIVGTNERAMVLESRKLGASRMTARFIKSDPPEAADIDKLRKHYRKELRPVIESSVLPVSPVRFIGTSGTLENVAAMCASTSKTPDATRIERKRLDKLVDKLLASKSEDRATMPGLDAQRKDQIIAGVVLVQELMDLVQPAGLEAIDLCGTALREGILVDYVQRKLPKMQIRRDVPDPRRRSVLDLCRRCEWHKQHSTQVTRLALRLFDELSGLHELGPLDRELLEYASLMHDIGWHIGGKGHHKHSAYLIRHGKLKGFTDEEVETMANIARYHRKADAEEEARRVPRIARAGTSDHRHRLGLAPRRGRAGSKPRQRRPRRPVPHQGQDGAGQTRRQRRRGAGSLGCHPQERVVRDRLQEVDRVSSEVRPPSRASRSFRIASSTPLTKRELSAVLYARAISIASSITTLGGVGVLSNSHEASRSTARSTAGIRLGGHCGARRSRVASIVATSVQTRPAAMAARRRAVWMSVGDAPSLAATVAAWEVTSSARPSRWDRSTSSENRICIAISRAKRDRNPVVVMSASSGKAGDSRAASLGESATQVDHPDGRICRVDTDVPVAASGSFKSLFLCLDRQDAEDARHARRE